MSTAIWSLLPLVRVAGAAFLTHSVNFAGLQNEVRHVKILISCIPINSVWTLDYTPRTLMCHSLMPSNFLMKTVVDWSSSKNSALLPPPPVWCLWLLMCTALGAIADHQIPVVCHILQHCPCDITCALINCCTSEIGLALSPTHTFFSAPAVGDGFYVPAPIIDVMPST